MSITKPTPAHSTRKETWNTQSGRLKKSSHCVVCGSRLRDVLHIPGLPLTEKYEPWAETFEPRGFVDQTFAYCPSCSHGQLGVIVPPEDLYGEGYQTQTSSSVGASAAVQKFRRFIETRVNLDAFNTVIDIGANDCSLLNLFPDKRRVAIDPNARGDAELVREYVEKVDFSGWGTQKLIVSSNTVEHLEDPNKLFGKLSRVMGRGEIGAFQFPSLDLLIRDSRIDQIHHQHIHYFSLRSISLMLAKHGFVISSVQFDADHYGQVMVLFHKGLGEKLGKTIPVKDIAEADKVFKLNCLSTGARLRTVDFTGYGAALMLPLFARYIPELERMSSLVDEDERKHGLRYINFNKRIEKPGGIEGKTFCVCAVSTKLATRKIVTKLFEGGARDVILPLGSV